MKHRIKQTIHNGSLFLNKQNKTKAKRNRFSLVMQKITCGVLEQIGRSSLGARRVPITNAWVAGSFIPAMLLSDSIVYTRCRPCYTAMDTDSSKLPTTTCLASPSFQQPYDYESSRPVHKAANFYGEEEACVSSPNCRA